MMSTRNEEERPLTARSVLASTLLGLDPPVLPAARLVAFARLFGIAEGTARVALSRMVANGELAAEDGAYRLTGRLLDRQARQGEGRRPRLRAWRGAWVLAVVTAERRSPAERAELRTAMASLRLGELREGVWTRPDNLGPIALPPAVAGHCLLLTGRLEGSDDAAVAGRLWDLDAWARRAERLRRELTALPVESDDVLAPGFVLSAAVLRHLAGDPLLPDALLPDRWPGRALRAEYDAWDAAYRARLARWHREREAPPDRRTP